MDILSTVEGSLSISLLGEQSWEGVSSKAWLVHWHKLAKRILNCKPPWHATACFCFFRALVQIFHDSHIHLICLAAVTPTVATERTVYAVLLCA
jgi:hypothetical protein